jgi:hypothetical protein
MISVNNHSSSKISKSVFKYTFLTVFGVLVTLSGIYCKDAMYSEAGQIIDEVSDNELRIEEKNYYLPTAGAAAYPSYGKLLHSAGATHAINEHVTVQLGETETTEETTIVENETTVTTTEEVEVRQNKLYCVIEDGFTSTPKTEYLDYL